MTDDADTPDDQATEGDPPADAPEDTDASRAATDGGDDREPKEQVRRIERLRLCLLAVDQATLRRALQGLPAPVLDSVAKAVRVRPPVLRAGSPRVLRRLHDPLLLDTVATAVSDDCLEAVREHLGDEADDPSADAVNAAVDAVLAADFPMEIVRLTLASVAAGQAEAADICDALVDADDRFPVPDEAELEAAAAPVSTAPAPTTRSADAATKEARKARRAAEAERKRQQQEQRAAAEAKRKVERKQATAQVIGAGRSAADDDDDDGPSDLFTSGPRRQPGPGRPPIARRRPILLGDEARDFDGEDPLIGSVVIAEIWFPAGEDPDEGGDELDGGAGAMSTVADAPPGSDLAAKRRPCVVIGVSNKQLLVRAGYSAGGRKARSWQSHQVEDLRAAGVDRPTWIAAEHHRIDRVQAELPPLGRLSARDWNALW